jgi:hypothetical protein
MNDITCPLCNNVFTPVEGRNKWNQRMFNRILAECPQCQYKGPYSAFLTPPGGLDVSMVLNDVPTRSQGFGVRMTPGMFGIDPMMQTSPTSLVAERRGKFIRRSILRMLLDED